MLIKLLSSEGTVLGRRLRDVCIWSLQSIKVNTYTALFRAFLGRISCLNRGSAISSIPKLMSERPAPRIAIQAPGGTNHHQRPPPNAPACCAQYKILPQLGIVPSPRPSNSSAAQVSTTSMVVLTKPATTTPIL